MSILVTGGNGYLGSYVCTELLANTDERLALLVRGRDRAEATKKLWASWQLHMDPERFRSALERVDLVLGDLHAPGLGLDAATRDRLAHEADSVVHIAATLNRKSEKACLNTNLRGTLAVVELAQTFHDLRRFSYVSTVAVAGQRQSEVVTEDAAVDWNRSDYDPYGRTKKFCEHLVRTMLPADRIAIFRPSMVIGDSRTAKTSQFDMVMAVCILADLPITPLGPDLRQDIVPADYAGRAIATLHARDTLEHDTFHVSAGTGSAVTAREISDAIANRRRIYAGRLARPFHLGARALARLPRKLPTTFPATLFKVYWPYVVYDTVFDNTRLVEAMGEAPPRFTTYASDLYAYAKGVGFRFPAEPLPPLIAREAA